MKKILIMAHDFPGTGGSRIFKFSKYLDEAGYQPFIVTNRTGWEGNGDSALMRELQGKASVYKTVCMNKSPFRVFSRFFHSWSTTVFFEKLFFVPDLYVTWMPSSFLKGLKLIKKERIDALLTSSPPESVHLTGLFLKKLTGIPWIADFQDLWTTKDIVNRPATPLHRTVTRKLERLVYDSADHIVSNTAGNKVIYTSSFHIPGTRITVIPNGYDLEGEETPVHKEQTSGEKRRVFTVGYLGQFDKNGFPWQPFLIALKDLASRAGAGSVRLRICGPVSYGARRFMAENGVDRLVDCVGILPHREAFDIVRQSDLLLLLLYETGYSRAIVPHKLYYYLSMAKPVMAIAETDGEVAAIIRKTRTGRVTSVREPCFVLELLAQFYDEWKTRGRIEYRADIDEIKMYAYRDLTHRLAETVDMVLERRVPWTAVESNHGRGACF